MGETGGGGGGMGREVSLVHLRINICIGPRLYYIIILSSVSDGKEHECMLYTSLSMDNVRMSLSM